MDYQVFVLPSGFTRKREPFCTGCVVRGQGRRRGVLGKKDIRERALLLPTWGTCRMGRVQLDLLVLPAGCCTCDLVSFTFTPCNEVQTPFFFLELCFAFASPSKAFSRPMLAVQPSGAPPGSGPLWFPWSEGDKIQVKNDPYILSISKVRFGFSNNKLSSNFNGR
jgi:hypothetical protein